MKTFFLPACNNQTAGYSRRRGFTSSLSVKSCSSCRGSDVMFRMKYSMKHFVYGGFFFSVFLVMFTFAWNLTIYRFFSLREGKEITIYAFGDHPLFSRTNETKLGNWVSTLSSEMPNKFILIGIKKNWGRYYVRSYDCYRALYELYLQQEIDKSSLQSVQQKISDVLLQNKRHLLPYPKLTYVTDDLTYLKIYGFIFLALSFLVMIFILKVIKKNPG